jgi:hypothetical protein
VAARDGMSENQTGSTHIASILWSLMLLDDVLWEDKFIQKKWLTTDTLHTLLLDID